MALAVLVLSTDGVKSATLIGKSKQDALEALDAVHDPARMGFVGMDEPEKALRYLCRAWEVLGE